MEWFKVYPTALLRDARRQGLTLEAMGFLVQICAVVALYDGEADVVDWRLELRPVLSPKKFAKLREACGPLVDAYLRDVRFQTDAYLAKAQKARRSAKFRWAASEVRPRESDANAPADAPTVATPIARAEKRRQDQPPPPPGGERLDQRFERFWLTYPRRVNKSRALIAWAKLSPDEGLLEQMLAALMWQRELPQWTKENGAFVPHASTWLRGRLWEDEQPVPVPTTDDDSIPIWQPPVRRGSGG